jgi:predicted DNA-binding transcriptional regulator YafY
MASLQAAVFGDEVAEAEYERYDGSSGGGRLEPYGLVAKSGLWYLVARRAGEFRCYRVSRLRSFVGSGSRFDRDEGFDLRAWWPANAERFAAEFSAYKFSVAIPEGSLPYLRRIAPGRVAVLGSHGGERGWIGVEVGLDSRLYAELIVLGLGAQCRVLEPDSLAAAVVSRARETIAALESSGASSGAAR